MSDLYRVLSVDEFATQVQIKAAYRKKAQQWHPDRPGGDVDEFQRIQEAYEVLGKPERRAQYDENGQHSDRVMENELKVRALINTFFDNIINRDVITGDNIVDLAIELFEMEREEQVIAITQHGNHIRRLDRLRGRIVRRDDGINFYDIRLARKVKELKAAIAHAEGIIALYNDTIEEMKNYDERTGIADRAFSRRVSGLIDSK